MTRNEKIEHIAQGLHEEICETCNVYTSLNQCRSISRKMLTLIEGFDKYAPAFSRDDVDTINQAIDTALNQSLEYPSDHASETAYLQQGL